MYDLIIIGAGPAGTSAGVYAARKQLKTLLLTKDFDSQSTVSPAIYNWIGTPVISGSDLAKSFKEHLEYYTKDGYLELSTGKYVKQVTQNEDKSFIVVTEQGDSFQTKAVLVASGSSRRKLTIEGADEFEHKGIVYCATCDGPLFQGQDVAVIGGGNAGFETAAQLSAYTKSVTIIHRSDNYKADAITVEKVLAKPNVVGVLNANTLKVSGDKFVTGLTYEDRDGIKDISVTGVFVEIGQIPNTEMIKTLVDTDEYNRIKIDPWTQRSSLAGVWAAGDCSNVKYHQNNISAGDAVKAIEDIYMWLQAN